MGEGLTTLGNRPADIRHSFRMLLTSHQIRVLFEHRVVKVEKQRGRTVAIQLEHAPPDRWGVPPTRANEGPLKRIEATVFIDASCESDVMALSGVQYAVGRESRDKYGEQHAGIHMLTNLTPISPCAKPNSTSSGLLKGIEVDHGKPLGVGDDYTQVYNVHYCVTSDPSRREAITPPDDYDAADFEWAGS